MTRYAVVVPTNRPERIKAFIAAWEPQFHNDNVRLIVVEDAPTWTIDLLPEWVEHRCWLDIDRELGDKASCIPTQSGGIRDFGFYLAGKDESIDMIVSLDDDVLPIEGVGFLAEHWQMLETPLSPRWFAPMPGFRLRGEPYAAATQKPVFNMGLWHGYPDVDALTQLQKPDCDREWGTLLASIQLIRSNVSRSVTGLVSRLVPAGQYAPFCFAPSVLISMADGTTKPIKEVGEGDYVLTDRAEMHPVLSVTKRYFEGEIVRIQPAGSVTGIEATPEHHILTAAGWKAAGDITTDDHLLMPRLKFERNILSDDDMYLIGLFLAEGSYSKYNNRGRCPGEVSGVQFAISNTEEKTLGAEIKRIMRINCDADAYRYVRPDSHSLQLQYYSKDIAEWFHKWCGEYSYGKQIHPRLMQSQNICLLIKGLFAGDGHIATNRERPMAQLKGISFPLMNQVKMILNGLGYYSGMSTESANGMHRKSYTLSLYGNNAMRFNKEVMGIETKHRNLHQSPARRYEITDDYIKVIVRSTERLKYTGEVYDLSIEGNHTFLASGCVVHNCGMNIAFRREVAPYYYFPKLPDGMKRWDDIWAGVIFKRLADVFEWAVTCGWPILRHERASEPLANLRQEFLGYSVNENLWQIVDQIKRVYGPTETHYNIIQAIWDSFPQLRESTEQMNVWASLWAKPNLAKSPESLYFLNGGIVTASELPASTLTTSRGSGGVANTVERGNNWMGDMKSLSY